MVRKITRIRKSDTFVPNSFEKLNLLINELGKTLDQMSEIESGLENEIAELKKKTMEKIEALKMQRDRKVNASFSFVNPRKRQLTKFTRSTFMDAGVFGWRMTPPRVVTDRSDEEIIAILKATGNSEFIRVKEEVDRRALLRERPVIAGISFEQSDEFFIVPKGKQKNSQTVSKAIDR